MSKTTKKETIHGLFKRRPKNGLTDYEVEEITGWTHQGVSGTRRKLVLSGDLKDSGKKRINQHGNLVTVWVVV